VNVWVGVAANAKAGAAVILADGSPVFLDGVAAWPEGRLGKRVRVRGKLVTRVRGTKDEQGRAIAGWQGEARFIVDPVVREEVQVSE
jgi:hypothetical protein